MTTLAGQKKRMLADELLRDDDGPGGSMPEYWKESPSMWDAKQRPLVSHGRVTLQVKDPASANAGLLPEAGESVMRVPLAVWWAAPAHSSHDPLAKWGSCTLPEWARTQASKGAQSEAWRLGSVARLVAGVDWLASSPLALTLGCACRPVKETCSECCTCTTLKHIHTPSPSARLHATSSNAGWDGYPRGKSGISLIAFLK